MNPQIVHDRKSLPAPALSPDSEQIVHPRNAIEERLAQIWGKLLDVRSIGVTDNFFELGGHSLLAMRLFTEIEKVFDKNLPVSLIFKEDTIEKLAKLLSSDDIQTKLSSYIVVMQPHGNKPPLFCIHELDGEVISYRNLVSELGDGRPVFGLRDTRGENGSPITIHQLAAAYIKEIRSIQPDGPYLLLGYFLGGLIAYEIAQQLKRMDQEVSLLGILDASNPKYYPAQNPFVKNIMKNIKVLCKIRWSQKVPFFKEKLRHVLVKRNLLSNTQGKEAEQRARGFLNAIEAYDPKPYSGKIVFFRADDNVYNLISDDHNGWETTAGGTVDVFGVPGNHSTLLDESNVKHVVKYLKGYL